jgi:succinate dehydrogenase/fumarate reductase cytochrome b subunit
MNSTLKKLHHLSGIVIASFLLLHVTNHLFALGGPALHIGVMNLFRHVYRFLPVKILLLVCVIFQLVSGGCRYLYGGRYNYFFNNDCF